jgi:hypothetical protein
VRKTLIAAAIIAAAALPAPASASQWWGLNLKAHTCNPSPVSPAEMFEAMSKVQAAVGLGPPKIAEYNGMVVVRFIDPRNGQEVGDIFFRTKAECQTDAEALAHELDRYR